jgi:hypothetical protein
LFLTERPRGWPELLAWAKRSGIEPEMLSQRLAFLEYDEQATESKGVWSLVVEEESE